MRALNKFTQAENYLLHLSPFLIYLLHRRKRERELVEKRCNVRWRQIFRYVLSRYNLLECWWKAIFLVKFILSTVCRRRRYYSIWMYWNATIVSCWLRHLTAKSIWRYKNGYDAFHRILLSQQSKINHFYLKQCYAKKMVQFIFLKFSQDKKISHDVEIMI